MNNKKTYTEEEQEAFKRGYSNGVATTIIIAIMFIGCGITLIGIMNNFHEDINVWQTATGATIMFLSGIIGVLTTIHKLPTEKA